MKERTKWYFNINQIDITGKLRYCILGILNDILPGLAKIKSCLCKKNNIVSMIPGSWKDYDISENVSEGTAITRIRFSINLTYEIITQTVTTTTIKVLSVADRNLSFIDMEKY